MGLLTDLMKKKHIPEFNAQHTPDVAKTPSAISVAKEHQHNWEMIKKTYAPPMAEAKGITNLLFECTSCKDFRKEEMIGSDETQLDEVISKVEIFGSQLVKYNNTFYLVTKYVPPTQQTSNLSLR